jgi:hypothetical protein
MKIMQLKIKAIPGYQYYYADTDGNIYSVTPELPQKFFDLAKLQITETKPGIYYHEQTGKIKVKKLKPHKNSMGYYRVVLYLNGKFAREFVHRLVLMTFRGPFPPGKETNHIDGNILNNKLSNLEFVTHAENIQLAREAERRSKNYDYTKTKAGDPF